MSSFVAILEETFARKNKVSTRHNLTKSRSFLATLWLTVVVYFLHIVVSLYPSYDNSLGITDELIYAANAARILNGQACTGQYFAQFPRICNYEHPPLGKLLIIPGIVIFGHNSFGWRFVPQILGVACIPLVYLIAFKLSKNGKLAFLASLLLSLDTLFFMQSNMANLDTSQLFFGMAAFAAYFYEVKASSLNMYLLIGFLMGLSVLCKETGVFLLGALLVFHLIFGKGELSQRLKESVIVFTVTAMTFAVGLQLYDSLIPTPFTFFTQQISYILNFGINDRWFYSPGLYFFTAHEPLGVVNSWVCQNCWRSLSPFDWVTFFSPVEYAYPPAANAHQLITIGNFRFVYDTFAYYGITNMFETWTIYIWIPLAVYLVFKYRRDLRTRLEAADKTLVFALIWFGFTYVPYILLYFESRAEFEYYLVSAVPAIAIGAAYLITRPRVSNKVTIAYLILVFLWFLTFFPDKAFLPSVIHL